MLLASILCENDRRERNKINIAFLDNSIPDHEPLIRLVMISQLV